MTVILEQFAVQELFDATEYYSSQSRTAAEKFIEDVEHTVILIRITRKHFPISVKDLDDVFSENSIIR